MLTVGRPGVPPAARTGAARNPRHSLAGRGAEVQHAAGPRFHHRRACAREGYKAIFLGIGLPKGRKLPLPGADTEGVIDGMDFLRAFNAGNAAAAGQARSW